VCVCFDKVFVIVFFGEGFIKGELFGISVFSF